MKLKQQSKNLRVNATILNHLKVQYGNSYNTIIAIDMTGGTSAYFRKLTKRYNNTAFESQLKSRLFIPKEFSSLHVLKDTLNALFFMKSFYLSMSKDLKKSIVSQDMNSQLEGLITLNDEADVNRNTYDLVYFKSNKKRPAPAQAVALKLLAHSMTIESPRVDPEH